MTGAPRALARRYARAVLGVVAREGEDALLARRDELRAFVPLVEGHPALRRALLHPGLGVEPKRRVLAALADRAGASPLLRRLLDLLASRDRLALLPEVVEAYADLANARRSVVAAEAVSAVPLAEAQRRGLIAALAGGGAVELRTRVDPGVLGGLLVRVGERTYDGTVRTRLLSLRRRLASSG